MSALTVTIMGLEGKSIAMVTIVVTRVMKAAALAFRASTETEQAAMEVTASSSNFLQVEKASLQAFRPCATAATSGILQSLTASLAAASSGAAQQVQASTAVASLLSVRQASAAATKVAEALTHSSTKVMLGMGKSVVQEALTATSQSNRVLVRLVSCRAPSEVAEPEQVRADLLPPPRSTSLRAMGPNTDCLPDFLPAMVPCLSILVFCFSKLATTSFHLLITVMAFSRHTPSTVLADFLVPFELFLFFLLVLFLLFLLFPLPEFFFFPLFPLLFFLRFLRFFPPFLPLFLLIFIFLPFLLLFLLLPASASASLAILEEETSSETLFSSLFSAVARTARTARSPKRMNILVFIFLHPC